MAAVGLDPAQLSGLAANGADGWSLGRTLGDRLRRVLRLGCTVGSPIFGKGRRKPQRGRTSCIPDSTRTPPQRSDHGLANSNYSQPRLPKTGSETTWSAAP